MRFDRLELACFGHFHDRALDFPSPKPGAPDLHIIAGANEAGKSTLRAAIGDLLFGVAQRTPFAFRHPRAKLLLRATIRAGDSPPHTLERSSKRKTSLRAGDGAVLPEDYFARLLAGLDKAAYERQFALDHTGLIEGGRALLDNRDDLSRLLFEAASGVRDFGALQNELNTRADSLWKRDGRAKTAFREAMARLKQADKARRAAITTAPAYERLTRTLSGAEAAFEAAREQTARLEAERAELERLRRTAPIFARLGEIDERLAALKDDGQPPPLLAENASARVSEARREDALLRQTRERADTEKAEAEDALERLGPSLDPAILDHAAQIEALAEERARVGDFPGEIAELRAKIGADEARALDTARKLGWRVSDVAALRERLPAAIRRRELAALMSRREALEGRRDSLRESREDIARELAAIKARLKDGAGPEVAPAIPLADAVAGARALGDAQARLEELQGALASAERAVEALKRDLRPWSGALEELADLEPPSLRQADQMGEKRAQHAEAHKSAGERVTNLSAQHKERAADIAARRKQRHIVDQAQLDAARQARDALWHDIKAGKRSPPTVAGEFESAIASADERADQRFAAAEAISAIEQGEIELAKIAVQFAEAQTAYDTAADRLEAHDEKWRAAMAVLGLGALTPEEYRSWHDARRRALEALDRLEVARETLARFEDQLAQAQKRLSEALTEMGAEDFPDTPSALFDLLRRAESMMAEAERRAARRQQDEERRAELAVKLKSAQPAYEKAETALADWLDRWHETLKSCGLAETLLPETAGEALERMDEIEAALSEIARLENERISPMEGARQRFAQFAAELARRLAPETADEPPEAIAQALAVRLRHAREAESRRKEITRQIEAATEMADIAASDRARLLAELSPLFADAGIAGGEDLDALEQAARRSDELRKVESERERTRKELFDAADGIAPDELARALGGLPAAEREARMAALAQEQEQASAARDQAAERLAEAKRELEAVTGAQDGGSAAARAEAERQSALAELATIADHYIAALSEARLLGWAIARYRAENESALLTRARELFAALTLGNYSDLIIDAEAQPPVLLARRALSDGQGGEGEICGVEGLSDGTRDQLFLALRVAAVEIQLGRGAAPPFIADDLFVNYDDSRAAAGLRVLADLARQTQILFLTHHDHLAELARETLGEAVNIVRL